VGPYASYVVQTVITLLAVCALAFVVLYGARRLGIGRPRGPIDLVGVLPLEARRSIYLVRVAEQVIIIGASEAGFTKLGEMMASALPPADPPPRFADVLARATRRAESEGTPRVRGDGLEDAR
jgi:flagellar biogenesis protein FliO